MPKIVLTILLLFFILISCQPPSIGTIIGKVEGKVDRITLNQSPISVNEEGLFTIEQNLDFSTILRINVDGQDYEVFIQPGKTVNMTFKGESVSYQGDLVNENKHLLTDKQLNDELGEYLSANWYTLHSKPIAPFIHIMDSIKGLYLSSMKKVAADQKLKVSPDFVTVNEASIGYSLDRMILRYPEWHLRFTGEQLSLPPTLTAELDSKLDAPTFLNLDTYQKYVRTWLNLKAKAQLSEFVDTSIYEGRQQLDAKLNVIAKQFTTAALRDFWSFEVIQTHVEEYTWVNSKEYLTQFIAKSQTTSTRQQAEAYEKELLLEREGHEIRIYKSVKEQQLEVHLFRPENFDTTQSYATLVAFHGGGWMEGNASWTFSSAGFASKNGMIGVAVEYRLSNRSDVTPVEAMEDTRDAISWLRANAKSLQIDPDKIVGKGISAGGHLISAISVLQDDPPTKYSSVPNSLVLVSPALNMQEDYFKGLLRREVNPSHLSALENLRPDLQMPPTLLLQGQTDRVTPTAFAQQFKSRMDSLQYNCKLVIYENCGHVFTPSHLDDTGIPIPDPAIVQLANEEQIQFFKELNYIK